MAKPDKTDEDGRVLNLIVTSSVDAAHKPTAPNVHLNTYVFPAVPVKFDVGLAAFEKLPPIPETIDHEPDELAGKFAERATVVNPQVEAPV